MHSSGQGQHLFSSSGLVPLLLELDEELGAELLEDGELEDEPLPELDDGELLLELLDGDELDELLDGGALDELLGG